MEDGDQFIHYIRQGKLGDGVDYFGTYCEDHAAWFKVQPKNLGLKEINAEDVLVPNKYTRWVVEKLSLGKSTGDIGLEVVQKNLGMESELLTGEELNA